MYVMVSRVFWMMLGPLLIAVAGINIVNSGNGWFTLADIAFLLMLGGVVMARWLELQSGGAQTSTGEPATASQVYRFMLFATIVGLAAWIAANFVGNYWLGE